jgi:peptide deformylase
MAIRRIYETPDPVLRQISKPVETFDDELKTLVADMFETMYEAPGIGLAAVQVGVPIRLLVIDLQEPADPEDPESKIVRDPRVFVNPEILWHSDSEVPYTEGCLSVPEQYAPTAKSHTPRDACRCRSNMPRSCGPTASGPSGRTRPGMPMRKRLTACSRSASSMRWTI